MKQEFYVAARPGVFDASAFAEATADKKGRRRNHGKGNFNHGMHERNHGKAGGEGSGRPGRNSRRGTRGQSCPCPGKLHGPGRIQGIALRRRKTEKFEGCMNEHFQFDVFLSHSSKDKGEMDFNRG